MLVIHGGRRLSGRIAVEGNKNAALPLLAACLLTDETCEIHNVPRIRDVAVMIELLRSLGAEVEGQGTPTLRVTCRRHHVLRARSAAGRPAARIGAAAGRAGRADRPRDARAARRRLSRRAGRSRRTCARCARWARASSNRRPAVSSRRPHGLTGASIYLLEASVTGTETALLAAARATGVTEIRNAACEPHVAELGEFLRAMGADVEGIGSSTIRIEAPARLHGATHTLRGDYIEAASWGVVGAITGGEVEITGAMRARTSSPSTAVLAEMGLAFELEDGRFAVRPSQARRRAADHDRPVAGLPERHRQPRDGAGDAGRRPDARARLDVRAAPVRARAAERDARRSLPLRPAPDHRHRPDASSRGGRSTAATSGPAWRSSPPRSRPKARARCSRSKPSSAATRTWSNAYVHLGAEVERK